MLRGRYLNTDNCNPSFLIGHALFPKGSPPMAGMSKIFNISYKQVVSTGHNI